MKAGMTVLGAVALALFAVSSAGAQSSDESNKRMQALYAEAKSGKQEVVLYTSTRDTQNRRLSQLWAQKFPDVKLTVLRKSGLGVLEAVETEKAAGGLRADVVTHASRSVAEVWKSKDYYEAYKPADFDQYPSQFRDADGNYIIGQYYIITGVYNTNLIKDTSQLPTSVNDLLQPKWASQLVISDPATSTATLYWFMGMIEAKAFDWSYIEALAKQKVLVNQSATEAERMLVAGERPFSPSVSSLNVVEGMAKGQPVALLHLKEGAVVGEIMFGIMKGTKNLAAAKLLVEFMASVEGENALPAAHQTWPTHKQAVASKELPDIKGDKLLSISDTSQKTVDEFNKRFADTFRR
jgi:iron(III) transport system substrate-binding protein